MIYNCNWVDIRWQQYSTKHTNNTYDTENGTYITIKNLRTSKTIKKNKTHLGIAGRYTLAFALKLRKKHRKPSFRVAARTSQTYTVQNKKTEQYNTQKKNSNTEQYRTLNTQQRKQ
jgi:hypothetical protein